MGQAALASEGLSLNANDIVNSQVAVGSHIIQIGSVTGGKVVLIDPRTVQKPAARSSPVLLRGRRPAFFTNRETPLETVKKVVFKWVKPVEPVD